MQKKTLIYGGGAIGSFMAACLRKSNHKIFFLCRKKNYYQIKNNGLRIDVYNNEILLKKYLLTDNKNFIVINSLKKIKNVKFDNIFITTKITENLKQIFNKIDSYIGKKTIVITPCTSIPFWWYLCLNKKFRKKAKEKLDKIFQKNLNKKNLVGMTMWLSAKITNPGCIRVNHIQRGFPIKEVFSQKKKLVDSLRNDIKKVCISPKVKNIFSEIYIKSLNSLAFNLIALKFLQNNKKLKGNHRARQEILKILVEGDRILQLNNIKVYQTPISRISQTLKSTSHTMSMLYSFKNKKKIELKKLWLSFESLIKIINLKMNFTKKTYIEVKKKINEFI